MVDMDEYYTTCPFPKEMRVVDLEAMRAYRTVHPYCEIPGCGKPAAKTPHHLHTRGSGGGDVPENLISLCGVHHSRAHNEAYFRRYVFEVKGAKG